MATQAIQVGGTVAVRQLRRPRPRAAIEPAAVATIRVAVAVILLALGLFGMAGTTSWAAGTAPQGGPGPGLDL